MMKDKIVLQLENLIRQYEGVIEISPHVYERDTLHYVIKDLINILDSVAE